MNTTTQRILLSSLALAFIFFGTVAFTSEKTPPPSGYRYLTVRTIEVINGMWDSKIVIIDENGDTEEIALDKFRSKNFTDNSKKIHEVLNQMAARGYRCVSSGSGNGDALIISTYMFEKTQ
jgi:hypothetical protein